MTRLLAALVVLLAAAPARAYVRTQTSTGTPVDWNGRCPHLALGGPANPEVSFDVLRAALLRSADAWNQPTQGCSTPRLSIDGGMSSAKDIGYDGTNVVLWRLPGFCDTLDHQKDDVCTSPNAAAVTTIFYVDKPGDPRDGQLLEADMELNAVDFHFADDGSADKIDLGNTLTHELGHVLGLDHTCYTVPGSAPPTDANGQPVPRCFPVSALPASVTRPTMFNFETPGETDKRIPTTEETSGLCSIYAGRPAACSDGGGGCSMTPATRTVPFGLLVLGCCVIALVRRLRRSRP